MLRKIKRVVSLIIAVISLLFVGCYLFILFKDGIGVRLYSEGYYIYSVTYEEPRVVIRGLTDLGKEQEILVIPQQINGYPVVSVGGTDYDVGKVEEKFGEGHAMFNSSKLKRIYVPFALTRAPGVYLTDDFIGSNTKLEAFVAMEVVGDDYWNCYLRDSSANYSEKKKLTVFDELYCVNGVPRQRLPANVTYYLNPGQEPDSVYWIDDYDGEKIRYIPPDPAREGFEFAGWFKERECVNKWDFENDIVPKKIYEYDLDGTPLTYTYVETKLYAKWIPV